jgi:hypothetical protein
VLRSLGQSWRFSADAGPLLGWATLGGHGYDENRKQSVFEYGVGSGLRIERGLGRFAVWLEWRTTAWTRSQRAELTGSTLRETLCRLKVSTVKVQLARARSRFMHAYQKLVRKEAGVTGLSPAELAGRTVAASPADVVRLGREIP